MSRGIERMKGLDDRMKGSEDGDQPRMEGMIGVQTLGWRMPLQDGIHWMLNELGLYGRMRMNVADEDRG